MFTVSLLVITIVVGFVIGRLYQDYAAFYRFDEIGKLCRDAGAARAAKAVRLLTRGEMTPREIAMHLCEDIDTAALRDRLKLSDAQARVEARNTILQQENDWLWKEREQLLAKSAPVVYRMPDWTQTVTVAEAGR